MGVDRLMDSWQGGHGYIQRQGPDGGVSCLGLQAGAITLLQDKLSSRLYYNIIHVCVCVTVPRPYTRMCEYLSVCVWPWPGPIGRIAVQ